MGQAKVGRLRRFPDPLSWRRLSRFQGMASRPIPEVGRFPSGRLSSSRSLVEMRQNTLRSLLLTGLILGGSSGCARHYHYYNGEPPGVCSPQPSGVYAPGTPVVVGSTTTAPKQTVVSRTSTSPVIMNDGAVCTVPSTGRSTSYLSSSQRADPIIVDQPSPSRVASNDPSNQNYSYNGSWRNRKEYVSSDYVGGGTTRVSGVVNDVEITR